MKKLLLILIALFPLTLFAGEDVQVSWTPSLGSTHDAFFIYYTDSTGTGHKISVDDANASVHVVPNVEFGPSTWAVSARCSFCSLKEGPISEQVAFIVESKGEPGQPTLDEVVTYEAPGGTASTPFRAKVADVVYLGECEQRRKNNKKLVCKGLRIN